MNQAKRIGITLFLFIGLSGCGSGQNGDSGGKNPYSGVSLSEACANFCEHLDECGLLTNDVAECTGGCISLAELRADNGGCRAYEAARAQCFAEQSCRENQFDFETCDEELDDMDQVCDD